MTRRRRNQVPVLTPTEEALLSFLRNSKRGFAQIDDPTVAERMFLALADEPSFGPRELATRLAYSPVAGTLVTALFRRLGKRWSHRMGVLNRLVELNELRVLDEGSLELAEIPSIVHGLSVKERRLIESVG